MLSNPPQPQLEHLILQHICPISFPQALGTLRAMSPEAPASKNISDNFWAFLSIFCQVPDVSGWLSREEATMQTYAL